MTTFVVTFDLIYHIDLNGILVHNVDIRKYITNKLF